MAARKPESFGAMVSTRRRAAKTEKAELPSPLRMMGDAIAEHFSEADPHFCQGSCAEDILARMNQREIYIIAASSLQTLHSGCHAERRWYRDALNTISDGTSSLKPEVLARIALERMAEDE